MSPSHATPWGRHVNEGALEWPPSPWRILRALIATWYLKAREISEPTIRSLAEQLSVPPTFRLPPATTAHTRHFMPTKGGDKTKVFDTFIQLAESDAILVAWDVTLTPDELAGLKTLASRLGYFGRAESLVIVRVLEGITATAPNTSPLSENADSPMKTELVRLLAPMTPTRYADWRREFLSANQPPSEGKKKSGKKPTTKDTPAVPEDLFAALHADTGELQAAGWNLPPGAQLVNYARPESAFAPATRPRAPRSGPLPTVARYAVVSAVAPRITQAVSIGDRVHDALCKLSDQGKGRAAVFTGKDADGKPVPGHRHAHILSEANGPRDAVTHITVWAEMGFNEAACLALRRLRKVWGHGGHDIHLVLHGIGQPGDFQHCTVLGQKNGKTKFQVWQSFTPFVSTRHAKTFRDGRPKIDDNGWLEGSAPHDLLRLLNLNSKWHGAKIRRQISERDGPFRFGNRHLRSLQFQTVRHDGNGKRGHHSGAAFIIEFLEPVSGPIAVGYGTHFGLGLFVPV